MTSTENKEKFNDDELVAPTWLNAEFLGQVLADYLKEPRLKVTELKLSPASMKGDHYASIMFRAYVSYTIPSGSDSKSLIIKTMPEQEGHKKEAIGASKIFITEIGMYTKALPKFEAMLREAGDDTKLFVPCIYHSLEPRQVMIFDDLVAQGYSVVRDRHPSIGELKAAYQKLAKWHACSFRVLHEEPEFLQEFKYGLFSIHAPTGDGFFYTGMGTFIGLLKEVPELTKYVPHFEKMKDDYVRRMLELLQQYYIDRQSNGYYVLGHCDFHARNIMFRHKADGNVDDVMLLDFQISNLSPITTDLIYSIYMLMGPEERHNSHKDLIDYYFGEFIETLQKIGYSGELPKSEELWKQISQHRVFDFFLISTFLPLMGCLKLKDFDPVELMMKEEARRPLYRMEGYVKDITILLARYEKLGYFDGV